ncbi:MAG: hypothetical protein ACOX9B_09930 [Candidatus Xenobium sp.]
MRTEAIEAGLDARKACIEERSVVGNYVSTAEVRLTTQTGPDRRPNATPGGGFRPYLPSGGPFVSIIPHSLTIIVSPRATPVEGEAAPLTSPVPGRLQCPGRGRGQTMRYLGVDHGPDGFEAWLVEESGRVLVRQRAPELQEVLAPCLEACRGTPMRGLSALPAGHETPEGWEGCPRDHALFAGALGGSPGILIDADLRARVLTLDLSGTLRVTEATEEIGLEPLRRRLETLLADVGPSAGRRLRRRVEAGQDPISACFELASWPGPDPDLRGLLLTQVRHLVHTVRLARSRMLGVSSPPGSWSGGFMVPPLPDLFSEEVYRFLPEVSWHPPRLTCAAGAVLLARAGHPDPRRGGLRGLLNQRTALKAFLRRLRDALE